MKYELAKQLKDAGFPQHATGKHNDTCMAMQPCVPTLEELIEACGDKFFTLELHNLMGNNWQAHSPKYNDYWTGSTPTEAVANLWLALNKN